MEDDAADNLATSDDAVAEASASVNPLADADTLAELRELLVGPERRELDELRRRLASSRSDALDIAAILPQAIALREQQDDQLARALSSTVEGAIQTSVKNNPQPMIDAVFPVIGPAIRKSVNDALTKAVQSLNQTLEHSLSVRSLKWRLEAARTGKPFAEVLMLHTLRYRVEQVFLIHAESGLLMEHVAAPGVVTRDEQLVSGMLTAITEFVRDSFSTDEQAGLQTMQVGGVTVWIEPGPHAVLAGAVRGSAPAELRELFQQVIEDLHLRHGQLLEDFEGDDTAMSVVEPELRRCLVSASQPGAKRKVSPAVIVLGVAVLGLLGWACFAGIRSTINWRQYVSRLESLPGVMLVEANHNWWGQSTVKGFYDSHAPIGPHAESHFLKSGVSEDQVRQQWIAFPPAPALTQVEEIDTPSSPAPPVEPSLLELAEALLDPPSTVTLRNEGALLIAEGGAPHAWVQRTRRTAVELLGDRVSGYVDDGLVDLDLRELETVAGRIESAVVAITEGSELDVASQRSTYESLVRDLGLARDAAKRLGLTLAVEVVGHTDTTGDAAGNWLLSEDRALAVAKDLEAKLSPQIAMVIRGAGSTEPVVSDDAPAHEQRQNRRVTFNVELRSEAP